tara:strand:+ start:240 stop:641 length:402 start_codon:yes stop_codon:yes gene_type:complete
MLTTNKNRRYKNQDQQQLSISNRSTHDQQYPFLKEFSELIADLPMKELKELMSYQQKLFAQSIWEAENYGGSKDKCIKRLTEIYGPNWKEFTSIKEHMASIREYYEFVLRIDHVKQWDNHNFWVNISEDKVLE